MFTFDVVVTLLYMTGKMMQLITVRCGVLLIRYNVLLNYMMPLLYHAAQDNSTG